MKPNAFAVIYPNGFAELQWADDHGDREYGEFDDRWGAPTSITPLYAASPSAGVVVTDRIVRDAKDVARFLDERVKGHWIVDAAKDVAAALAAAPRGEGKA